MEPRQSGRLLVVLLVMSGAADVCAAPSEIKVFTDELAAYHEHTLETHVNKARRGPWRLMPEYSYGLWRDWEFSSQLPFALGADGRLEGYRAELQYVAPHDDARGLYWGVNVELARLRRLEEPEFWNVEIIPIVGYRYERWHIAANPGFDKAISGATKSTRFEPAVKAAYRIEGRNYLGLEYYKDPESRTLYVAWDGKLGRSDINLGVGRGLADSPERWIVKMITEIAF